MAHALTSVTKKYGNLVMMCCVDEVVIATLTIEGHIERLDEVFASTKRAGLKRKPSKSEILKDSIIYLGRMANKHGIRPDPDSRSGADLEITENGASTNELLGFCELLQGIHQGLCEQSIPDATTHEAQRQEIHVE